MKLFRPNKPKTKDNQTVIIGYDIETLNIQKNNSVENEFILGCFSDGTKCRTKEEVINYLNNIPNKYKGKQVKIIATNLQFDFFGSIEKNYSILERKRTLYKTIYHPYGIKKKSISFYDTINLFPASVKKLGEIINIPKLNPPSFFTNRPRTNEEWEQLEKYCFNDALISAEFIKKIYIPFINKYGLKFSTTIGSTSLDYFIKHYLKKTYKIENKKIHEISFKSYYGGRTEIFKRGTFKNVKVYDVNSLYPAMMLKKFPDPNTVKYYKRGHIRLIEMYEGVSYIEAYLPKSYAGVLPVRIDKKLIFPCGNIKGFYCNVEIRNAIEKYGLIINKIGECSIYLKTEFIFKDYVEINYKKRNELKKENNPLEIMYKLMLNSLYGKFAFNYYENSTILKKGDETSFQLKTAKDVQFEGEFIILTFESDEPTKYSFPIWSSYVTAYARIFMNDFIQNENIKPYLIYSDTDSIFLSDGFNIKTSDKLGDFKLEYEIKKGYFVKPKFYYTKKPVIKGIKTVKTEEDFKKLVNTKIIEEERFIKYRTAIRSKEKHKLGKLKQNSIIISKKELSLEDEKRVWKNKFNLNKKEDSEVIYLT